MLAPLLKLIGGNPLMSAGVAAAALVGAWGLGQVQGRIACNTKWETRREVAEAKASAAESAATSAIAGATAEAETSRQHNAAVSAKIEEQADALDENDVCVPAAVVDSLRDLR